MIVLIEEQNSKLQKQVMSELLKKVSDLEEKVSTDVTTVKVDKKGKKGLASVMMAKKADSDTESQTSAVSKP